MTSIIRMLAIVLVALITWCVAALADEPTPETREYAQALIEATENGYGSFRVGDSGHVTHIQSGMVCPTGNDTMRLTRLVVTPGTTPGDDIACDYVTPNGKTTIFASRLGDQDFESYAANVFATVGALYPSAKPTDGPVVLEYPNISKPRVQSLVITNDGKSYISSTWVSLEREWVIQVRATYPAEPRHDPEFLAAVGSMYAQLTVHEHVTE